MSYHIKGMSSENFSDIQHELIYDLIRKTQCAYDKTIYKDNKDPHDKLKCIICGGSYSRQKKAVHATTKKHIAAEKMIYQVVNDLFSKVEP